MSDSSEARKIIFNDKISKIRKIFALFISGFVHFHKYLSEYPVSSFRLAEYPAGRISSQVIFVSDLDPGSFSTIGSG